MGLFSTFQSHPRLLRLLCVTIVCIGFVIYAHLSVGPAQKQFKLLLFGEDTAHSQMIQAEVTVVTGFSDNHFEEGMGLLNKTESFNLSVVVYNLGLNTSNKESLINYIAHQDRMQLRTFNFSKYPEFVSDLYQYRFKPIIVFECMHEFDNVLWLDVSMKLCYNYSTEIQKVVQYAETHSPVLGMDVAYHSIFAATHPTMYEYFPLNESLAKALPMIAAYEIFVHHNTQAEQIIGKWRECALEPNCMGPKGTELQCYFGNDRWMRYGNCHRFDQSALSMILALEYGWNNQTYLMPHFAAILRYENCVQ